MPSLYYVKTIELGEVRLGNDCLLDHRVATGIKVRGSQEGDYQTNP